MDAVHVAERRDAEAHHVRALPQPIGVDEARARRILDRGVGAAHVVAGRFERFERLATPIAASSTSRRPAARTGRCPSAGRR